MSNLDLDENAVRLRIQRFEDEFFDCVSAGEEALKEFNDRWADFAHCISPSSYSPVTIQQLHRVSTTISVLCESLINLEEAAQEIQKSLETEVDAILGQSTCADQSLGLSAPISSRRDVSLAAEWISQNYHNPYPSNSVRDDISRKAKWSRKDVDSWFTEARKKIGWNAIRKQFFANKQAEVVKTATDFFSGRGLSLEPALESALSAMAGRVEEIYVEPFQPSRLALILYKRNVDESDTKSRVDELTSTTYSRIMSLSPGSPNLQPLSPISRSVSPIRSAPKRRRSTVDDSPENCRKRARREEQNSITFPLAQLPSPAASQSDLAEQSPRPVVLRNPLDLSERSRRATSLTPLSNPKRGRSHSDTQERPKCPSVTSRIPGLQIVSTPLPSPPYSQLSTSPAVSLQHKLVPNIIESSSSAPGHPLVAIDALLPPAQVTSMHETLSQPEIPQFSFEFPGPVICDQTTAVEPIDLTLFDSTDTLDSQTYISNFDGTSLPNSSTLLAIASQTVPSINTADSTPLSTLFGDSLYNDQLLGLLPSFDQHTGGVRVSELGDSTKVDINHPSFLDFNPGTPPQLSELQADDIFYTDFFRNFSTPSAEDTEKARYMAHIEMLKQQKNHIQEHIQLLERRMLSA